ncbi:WSC domain-containing protein [Colletotrichum falcatum]|nr:WSC domain-containing protein [Colletotrichum falcatum]
MVCNGNPAEYCGGPNRLNVYDFQNKFQPPATSTSTSTSTPVATPSAVVASSSSAAASPAAPTSTVPSQPPTVGNWKWYGCQTEATNARALSSKTFAADDMTLESCAAFCDSFTYFGVEYSRECYCGNSFSAGSVPAPASDCSMKCAGNQLEFCGEGNRLSVYTIGGATQPSSSSSAPASTSTGPAVPIGTDYPTGWTGQGCWVDNLTGRILPNQLQDDAAMTLASCAQKCSAAGYTVAGAEYHTQCFCGNAIYNGGAVADDPTTCNTACGGKPDEMCGGPNRMTIISKGKPAAYQPPTPQTSGFNGSWAYQGCLSYEGTVRPLPWQIFFRDVNTANMCLDKCSSFGYAAAGLEYGDECYCGDPQNVAVAMPQVSYVPESQCNVVCAGNASAICGGGARLSMYYWTGKPLYSWDFGTDAVTAGSYELLLGGVCIPLMTMETITGKVTFLEKFGTGTPNSTGAYELDLSLVPDINTSWRPMHVKTDVFCSAGITLPDKAGRQLNLGGWSGDSTYGVRLYWPDGKPGTPGTNDWQEDVENLRMQDGRWYPSAMIMANGSIFVIGGEDGSNGAAVPTIEVLPFTGSPPLTMDWLARTDPNNLYPFVAVLPSENIFVAYWNEARILDKVTFNTIATLPNIPGSVSSPMAGRTYPLEGTGVLLPQYAPYTDPLGVLICGGSTPTFGFALDNCVSIQPEAANPQWVLERMPSPRVISCMAPLPDGTYLINNGAVAGVAGFGLATKPNLNALLYDPKKPIGQRITVMANTTIARLYHSESITLLDGRVLVSGSDPEDGTNPQEYRVEVFNPPYLTGKKPRPTFTLPVTDWKHGGTYSFTIGGNPVNGVIQVSLLGSVSSTHGNSMGARTIFPAMSCSGTQCTVTAPPGPGVAPPGWYQFFVLDGGIPAVGVYVRIGGDPASLGNWPNVAGFKTPGI